MAVALLALAGCVSERSAITGEKESFAYSWSQEQQLGAQTDQQIVAEMGLYENVEVQRYVAEVGQRVLQSSDLRDPDAPEIYRDAKFTFRVLDSPVVNAFALPGGYVYVTRGLLTHLRNEAQLAVVLGHEIGHVVARHASQQALKAQAGQLGLIGLAILGQEVFGQNGQDIAGNVLQIGGQGLQLLMFKYSRDAERESDELGVRYAGGSGYAPAEAAAFFESLERLSASEGRALPTWQSTHPDPGEREEKVIELARAWQPIGGGGNAKVGEEEFLRQIEGLVIGEDPREGFRDGERFYHPQLKFQLPIPRGWRLQNERAAVLLAEPNGIALFGLELAPGGSSREAAAAFVQQSGIAVVSVGEARVNGLPATIVLGQGQTQSGLLGVYDAFVDYAGQVYSLRGLAPAQVFRQVQPVFEEIINGFGPVRDERILAVQPARIRLVRTERAARFREFLPATMPGNVTAEQLAILNQVELDSMIPVGAWLKLPEM